MGLGLKRRPILSLPGRWETIERYGDLTQCLKCVAARRDAVARREERETNAPAIDISKIEDAFEAVISAGLSYRKQWKSF
jgi:hypothetical protein